VDRRAFLAGTLGLLAAPLAAGAQAVKVHRVGFLSYLGCAASINRNDSFRRGLRELGYVEGQNLAIECRDAPGQVDRFPDLARELIALNPNVIVAEGTPASLATKQATPIPRGAASSPACRDLAATSRGHRYSQRLSLRRRSCS
jgi:putative tryptophan/tyrosine transport system substrate-binding protein